MEQKDFLYLWDAVKMFYVWKYVTDRYFVQNLMQIPKMY